MLKAIIYIRVSTDEQAQKGYSQRSQEEKLNKYCEDKHIEIVQTLFEDHSAKSFNRPQWNAMMKRLTARKATRPDLILFSRWDRFSRNTANAYYMITQLQKMGIEPQAIDQPLDMSIPENKVLLAIYIVTAEVENDRRSLNIKQGIHKAKKEGRYMGKAPIGYINISLPDGRKTIVPREPEATLIRKVFETFEETPSIRLLHRISVENGLKCSLNAFFNMLQNPIYCGKINVKSLDGKSNIEVSGIHSPLISEELFFLVQSRIKHREIKYVKQETNSELMFRGMLYCPFCSRKLSGSGSKGRSKKYFYYHCYPPCSYRIKAEVVNENLLSIIRELKPEATYVPLFDFLVKSLFKSLYEKKSIDKVSINRSLHKLMERAANARELLIKGIIDEEDYHSIKADCENRIGILGEQLNNAYKLDVQQKQDFKRITRYFTNPYLILEETDNVQKIKAAFLFLKAKLVYDKTAITYNLNLEARIVCGFPSSHKDNLIKESSKEYESITNNLTRIQEDLIDRIIKIEKDKGHEISPQNALKVLIFLSNWAKICISLKNTEKINI